MLYSCLKDKFQRGTTVHLRQFLPDYNIDRVMWAADKVTYVIPVTCSYNHILIISWEYCTTTVAPHGYPTLLPGILEVNKKPKKEFAKANNYPSMFVKKNSSQNSKIKEHFLEKKILVKETWLQNADFEGNTWEICWTLENDEKCQEKCRFESIVWSFLFCVLSCLFLCF